MFQLRMILPNKDFLGLAEYSEAEISVGLEVKIMLPTSQVLWIFTASGWKSGFDDFFWACQIENGV